MESRGALGLATKARSPPALIQPPTGLGRCLQGRIAVKSQGVTQQRDISRRSISSTMNQSHKQPTKQPPPQELPLPGMGQPLGWCEQEMGRLWGPRGASSPRLCGGIWGGGTGKSPTRMRCLSETLQPEGFLQEKMQTRVAITSGKRSLCYCCFIFV